MDSIKNSDSKHTTQSNPVSLNNKLSSVWWLINSLGITLVPCIAIYTVLSSIAVLFVIIGIVAVLSQLGLWLILRQKVDKSWRWTLIGFLTWGLISAIAVAIYFGMEDFLNVAAQVPTGFMAVIMFWLIILVTGYLVTGLVLILANLYFDKLIRY